VSSDQFSDGPQWQTDQFEQHRAHLRVVAYRMLGSVVEADDAVQEAWLKVARSDTAAVENMRGWLTTIVSRVSLDMLRARRSRREELSDEPMPEPIVSLDGSGHPEQEALMADSVGQALLVVLDTLAPAERLAFVLHDMFGVPFEEIGPIVERTPAATRQLASRARRRIRGASPHPDSHTLLEQREVVTACLAASRNGDFDALVAVLDPDVQLRAGARSDTGRPTYFELAGRDVVARMVLTRGSAQAPFGRPAIVNGRPGAVVVRAGQARAAVAFTIVDGRVTEIDLTADPEMLRHLRVS
jgi:RNA polymerase sigma-70 factor (ECF subfamily)